jgi:ribonuclease T2
MIQMLRFLAIVLSAASCPIAHGQVRMEGQFVAEKDCKVVQSIKTKANPGDVSVSAGLRYVLIGKNRDDATHYWIRVPNAVPAERWVAVDCGRVAELADAAPSVAQDRAQPRAQTSSGNFYLLALSWEPTFCEGLPGKAECRTMTAQRADAWQFSLHGLWPQPRQNVFCGVGREHVEADEEHHWGDLPRIAISPETSAALDIVMPGTRSLLDRHEWIKHGTCYPVNSAEAYFRDSVRLTLSVNDSAVGAFVKEHAGRNIQSSDLRTAFDAAFGVGAGQRVRVSCKQDGSRQLISEITIGLKGDISGGASLARLIAASSPTDPGCPSGILDPAGLQ